MFTFNAFFVLVDTSLRWNKLTNILPTETSALHFSSFKIFYFLLVGNLWKVSRAVMRRHLIRIDRQRQITDFILRKFHLFCHHLTHHCRYSLLGKAVVYINYFILEHSKDCHTYELLYFDAHHKYYCYCGVSQPGCLPNAA